MLTCDRCDGQMSDGARCSICLKSLDFACSGITEAGYRKLGVRQSNWKCPTCKAGSTSKAGSGFSEKIEKLEKRVHTIETAQKEIPALKDRIKYLEDFNDKNQWLRSNNIEIKGVPMKDRENLLEIVTSIGNKIIYPVTRPSINFNFKSHNSGGDKTKPIIVSFLNRYLKEDFVAAARSFNTLRPVDIGLVGTGRIFVNDYLTVQNTLLLSKAKSLAKENDFDYVLVKNTIILVRKNSQSPVISIKKEKNLQKIQ
ncbi:hypothetical protein ACJJTC_003806 [Scirpophaga incertulas]